MSGKWLSREGGRWVREGIITPDQFDRITALYKNEDRSLGPLPLLGGLLLGLGVLTFVAANWQSLPNAARLALLLAVMLGFYFAGERQYARGRPNLGVALVGVGLFVFGGGLVLVHQMYHLMMYSSATLVVWAAVGAALTYAYRSRYLFAVTTVLTFVAQGYSLGAFGGRFSYAAFAVLLLGLAWYVRQRRDAAVAALWSAGVIVHWLLLVASSEWVFGWVFVPILLLYTAGDAISDAARRLALQLPALAAAFVFALVLALAGGGHWIAETYAPPAYYVPFFAALLAASLYLKRRRGELSTIADWLLLAPMLYAPPNAVAPLYLVTLFMFSLFTLLLGAKQGARARRNAGTAAFLISTAAAYFKLTWGFLDKSVFFLLGGALLLGLSWFLNRRANNKEGA